VPEGFEIIGDANTKAIKVKAKQIGSFDAGRVTVKVVNYCGEGEAVAGSGTITVVDQTEAPAMPTLALPATGTFLNPSDQYTITCGDVGADEYIGWILPEPEHFDNLWTYLETLTEINEQNEGWLSKEALAGRGDLHLYWDQLGIFRTSKTETYRVYSTGIFNTADQTKTATWSVRCIKNSCDEAPQNVSLSRLATASPVGGIDTIRVSYRTFGPDTTVTWTTPTGTTKLESTNTMIVLKYETARTFDWSGLSCRVENSCGSATIYGSGTCRVINDQGSQGILQIKFQPQRPDSIFCGFAVFSYSSTGRLIPFTKKDIPFRAMIVAFNF
jgi:hypothetical protein